MNSAILVNVCKEDFDWMLRGETESRRGLTLPFGGVAVPFVLEIVRDMTQRLRAADCDASWMIVCGSEVVGLCSYRRPPCDGRVEIGYGVAESRQNRGHATSAVAAMLQVAAASRGLFEMTAETSVCDPASSRVLEKNGFERTGTQIDVEDGKIVTWRKALRP